MTQKNTLKLLVMALCKIPKRKYIGNIKLNKLYTYPTLSQSKPGEPGEPGEWLVQVFAIEEFVFVTVLAQRPVRHLSAGVSLFSEILALDPKKLQVEVGWKDLPLYISWDCSPLFYKLLKDRNGLAEI